MPRRLEVSQGKSNWYDIVNRKENTSPQIDLTARQARSMARKAATGGGVFTTNTDVNADFLRKENSPGRELTNGQGWVEFSDENTRCALRKKNPPKKAGAAYKTFYARDFDYQEEAIEETAADYAGRIIDEPQFPDHFMEKHWENKTFSKVEKRSGASRKKVWIAQGNLPGPGGRGLAGGRGSGGGGTASRGIGRNPFVPVWSGRITQRTLLIKQKFQPYLLDLFANETLPFLTWIGNV